MHPTPFTLSSFFYVILFISKHTKDAAEGRAARERVRLLDGAAGARRACWVLMQG